MWKKLAVSLVLLGFGATTPALAQDTLTVGVTTTGIPFTFLDTASQKPAGAMVDIADAIGADLGMKVDFKIMGFSGLIPALQTGKINLISAGMFATAKREQIVNFTTPVYSYGDTMFVAASNKKNYTREELKGQVVGAQIGTVFADQLNKLKIFKEVKLYSSIPDIMRDVKLGRIKAGFGDKPIVAYQIKKNPTLGVRLVQGYKPMSEGHVALALAKGNTALLAKVNATLAKMEKSGKIKKIFSKYGL